MPKIDRITRTPRVPIQSSIKNRRKGQSIFHPIVLPSTPLTNLLYPKSALISYSTMSRRHDNRGGQRPTRGYRGRSSPGNLTDPERDQERGGGWGSRGLWAEEERRYTSSWTNPTGNEQLSSSSSSPTFPPTFPSTTFSPAFSQTTNLEPRGWNPPRAPSISRGPTALTNRIFDNAL